MLPADRSLHFTLTTDFSSEVNNTDKHTDLELETSQRAIEIARSATQSLCSPRGGGGAFSSISIPRHMVLQQVRQGNIINSTPQVPTEGVTLRLLQATLCHTLPTYQAAVAYFPFIACILHTLPISSFTIWSYLTWWQIYTMKLIFMEFFPSFCYSWTHNSHTSPCVLPWTHKTKLTAHKHTLCNIRTSYILICVF
jgi:hypothetical protein